jgi:hypothetical protein
MRLGERREFSQRVRMVVLLRAGFRCEICGARERLELHHVGHRADRSSFNALALCVLCHRRWHAVEREGVRRSLQGG